MWTVILVAANAIAAEPAGWDILTLHGRTLQRTHGSNTETVTTVDFLPASEPDGPRQASGLMMGADALYLSGSFGLGWVNLATRRAAPLTEPGRGVWDVHAAGAWLVYRSGDELRAWSSTEGHEVRLCGQECASFESSSTGSVVWVDAVGAHFTDQAMLDKTAAGEVVESKSIVPLGTGRIAVSTFSPDGASLVVFTGRDEYVEHEECDGEGGGECGFGAFQAAWFDGAGRPVRTERYENPEGMHLEMALWDSGPVPEVVMRISSETNGAFTAKGGALEEVEDAPPSVPSDTLPPGVALSARKVQGRHELFATNEDRTWQVTDLAAVTVDDTESCEEADAIGWLPMPDRRHVLIASTREWCLFSPDFGAHGHAYLADLGAASPQQIDLGRTVWFEGFGMDVPASGDEISQGVSWNGLGLYAPDRHAVITANGTVLSQEGTIVAKLGAYDWALWVPARITPPLAEPSVPSPAPPAPSAN